MTKNLPSKPESVAKKKVFTECHQCQNIMYFCLQFFYDRSDLATADLCVLGVGLVDYFGGEGGAKENVLRFQVPVVQWVDSTTHWINLYHCITQLVSPNTYPHDSDLSGGQFVHLWPGSGKIMLISCESLVTVQRITPLGCDTKL